MENKRRRIYITNDLHGTKAFFIGVSGENILEKRTADRLFNKLCPDGCGRCGGVGEHGSQKEVDRVSWWAHDGHAELKVR